MKQLRVLLLVHADLVPPTSIEGLSPDEVDPFRTEHNVLAALQKLGHDVRVLGLRDELSPIREETTSFTPDIAFNLLEEFNGQAVYDQNVVAYLELLNIPYTGCNPRGLILSRDKALTKKILSYHRIGVPDFIVVPKGRRTRRPKKLKFPLIVKSLIEEASLGIAQASVVDDDAKLAQRVLFIHDTVGTDAIVEQYIAGRELYVSVLGNQRLTLFPIWELSFHDLPPACEPIATAKAKWDRNYQKRHGITSGPAGELDERTLKTIQSTSKKIYRALGLSGYARIDFRLGINGKLYCLEANPNPQIAQAEDFAESAASANISYDDLIKQILVLGLARG